MTSYAPLGAPALASPSAWHVFEPKSWVDVAVLASAALFGVTCPLCLFDGGVLFTYHPSAMSVAFGLLMTLGVVSALKMRALGPGPERVKAIWAHAATQIFALSFAVGGFVAIYRNKSIQGKPHFTTTHGQVGLLAMVLAVLSPIVGGGAPRRNARPHESPHSSSFMKKMHTSSRTSAQFRLSFVAPPPQRVRHLVTVRAVADHAAVVCPSDSLAALPRVLHPTRDA